MKKHSVVMNFYRSDPDQRLLVFRVEQEEKDLSLAIDHEIEEKRQLLTELNKAKVSWTGRPGPAGCSRCKASRIRS